MTGTIHFRHDTINDIVVATPKWKIETGEDCKVWFNQWHDYLVKFERKVDCIMILDDFEVSGQIAPEWGKYRAKLIKELTRFSYRVNSSLITGVYTKTSGVRYNASSREAKTLESAIAAIIEDRKNAGIM